MRPFCLAAASLVVATLSSATRAETPPGDAPADAPVAKEETAKPPAPEVKKHGPRLPGVLLLALGASGLGAGAVLGVLAMTTGATARSQCAGTICPASAAPDIGKAKNFEGASYAAFAGGGTIALAGLILAVVAPGKPEDTARLAPWIGRGGAGLGFSASF